MSIPDLVAESQARANYAACLAAALPVRAHFPADTPRGLDPAVFSDFAPRRDPAPHGNLWRDCREHPGIQWYGAEPCWVCETR